MYKRGVSFVAQYISHVRVVQLNRKMKYLYIHIQTNTGSYRH